MEILITKHYKLIREYPGSPKLSTILTLDIKKGVYAYDKNNINVFRHKNEIENHPEFWEEVVEKEYEILSFYDKILKCLFTNIGNDKYSSPHKDFDLDWLLFCNDIYIIHSVKRMSDSEVFSIGDRVRISKLQCDGSFIIDRFYFDCNNDKLLCNGKCTGNGHVSITKIEKVKSKVLFRTEDGVDIYEGDRFWNTRMLELKEIQVTNDKYPLLFLTDGSKSFSTKEAAEEYINLRKPCLSINDILSFTFPQNLDENKYKEKLKQLVKSKL